MEKQGDRLGQKDVGKCKLLGNVAIVGMGWSVHKYSLESNPFKNRDETRIMFNPALGTRGHKGKELKGH